MKNITNYIKGLLAAVNKDKRAANNFIKISIERQNGAGDSRPCNRSYNKHNLWVAFNRYNVDAGQSDKTSGEYSFKKRNN